MTYGSKGMIEIGNETSAVEQCTSITSNETCGIESSYTTSLTFGRNEEINDIQKRNQSFNGESQTDKSNLDSMNPNDNLQPNVQNIRKPFRCKICKRHFSRSKSLINHERIHSDENPYQCRICKKNFDRVSSLKDHKRIHTGEEPFQCLTCKIRFKIQSNLKKHERIHTGEKPFQCQTCKAYFRLKVGLQQHERIHTGEKPYKCKSCESSFNKLNILKRHKSRYHK